MRSECSDPNAALAVVHKMDGLGFRRTLKVNTHTNTQPNIDQSGSSLFSRLRERNIPLNIKTRTEEIDRFKLNDGKTRREIFRELKDR